MKVTNLYLAFKKIKNMRLPMKYVEQCDYNGYAESYDETELNEKIKKSIQYIIDTATEERTQYVIFGNAGKYHVINNETNEFCHKIVIYEQMKYLFLVNEEYTILLNVEKEHEDFCWWDKTNTRWDYMPHLDDRDDFCYKLRNGQFIFNTYEAFVSYVKNMHFSSVLSKGYNEDFFEKVKSAYQDETIFQEVKLKWYNKVRQEKRTFGNNNVVIIYTCILLDYFVIVVNIEVEYLGKECLVCGEKYYHISTI